MTPEEPADATQPAERTETVGETPEVTVHLTVARGSAGRTSRRVTRAGVAGSDSHPGEPPLTPRVSTENDARLQEWKPPHWG